MTHRPIQIGFLGGSFDPPHLGHLNLAIALKEAHQLEEVWLCPTASNPFKQGKAVCSPEHRLKMTQLMIEDVPGFHVLDIECQKEHVHYTIDTLKQLVIRENQRSSPRQIRLLLGSDTAAEFPSWRNAQEIVHLAPPLVGLRSGQYPEFPGETHQDIIAAIERGRTIIPVMDISSTEIRSRLSRGLYCRHLLFSKVVDYIYYHHLY